MEAVLLNSGGMDTAVVAAMCHAQGWTLHSLFIDFNPHNSARATVAAQEIADRYCVDHQVFKFPVDWVFEVRPGIYGMGATQYVTVGLGISYAIRQGINYVFCGLKQDGNASSWVNTVADLVAENKILPVPVTMAPLESMTQDEMFAKAAELNLDLNFTCSCNQDTPCGTCAKCQLRLAHGIQLN